MSNDDIRKINIILPPNNELLLAFEEFSKKVIHCKNESQELAKLRDWLLPMLMNGQVTVQTDTKEETGKAIPIINLSQQQNQRFELWLSNQGAAARGEIDKATLREIFDAMDEDDK